MEKEFREFIRAGFVQHLASTAPEFRVVKKKIDSYYTGSLILEWVPREPLHCFIHLHFPKNQGKVIPYVQWSKLGRFPVETNEIYRYLKMHDWRIQALEALPEAWLSAWDFDPSRSLFSFSENSQPSLERMMQVFDRPDVLEELRATGVDDWRKATWLHSWGALQYDEKFEFTDEDIENAVGEVLNALIEVTEQSFLPYLRNTAARLLEPTI